jgi:hypothetical protein
MAAGQDHNGAKGGPGSGLDGGTGSAPPACSLPQLDGVFIALTTPRKLPAPSRLVGRVVVLDIAFASEGGGRRNSFEHTTLRLIEALGPRLVRWVDHHDSTFHRRFVDDERFVLATKAQHGACPEMISPSLVAASGPVDTIVCHNDFDGLASAAKWLSGGQEPYPGCDADARAIDTRIGEPGHFGRRFDRALRARPRDAALGLVILTHLASQLAVAARWTTIDEAADELSGLEERARTLAEGYRSLTDGLVYVDVTTCDSPYDRTSLLLLGQKRAAMAAVIDGDTTTFAAPFDSGVNFVERFGLSGGMPTLVSINRGQLPGALTKLGVDAARARQVAGLGSLQD